MKIAIFHTKNRNTKDFVELLPGFEAMEPEEKVNLLNFKDGKVRGYFDCGVKCIDCDEGFILDVTDEENKDGYTYFGDNYRDLAENGVRVDMFGHEVWAISGKTPRESAMTFTDLYLMTMIKAVIEKCIEETPALSLDRRVGAC